MVCAPIREKAVLDVGGRSAENRSEANLRSRFAPCDWGPIGNAVGTATPDQDYSLILTFNVFNLLKSRKR